MTDIAWFHVEQIVKQKLDNDRVKLETLGMSEMDTATIRGRISLAKEILGLPAELNRRAKS